MRVYLMRCENRWDRQSKTKSLMRGEQTLQRGDQVGSSA